MCVGCSVEFYYCTVLLSFAVVQKERFVGETSQSLKLIRLVLTWEHQLARLPLWTETDSESWPNQPYCKIVMNNGPDMFSNKPFSQTETQTNWEVATCAKQRHRALACSPHGGHRTVRTHYSPSCSFAGKMNPNPFFSC